MITFIWAKQKSDLTSGRHCKIKKTNIKNALWGLNSAAIAGDSSRNYDFDNQLAYVETAEGLVSGVFLAHTKTSAKLAKFSSTVF